MTQINSRPNLFSWSVFCVSIIVSVSACGNGNARDYKEERNRMIESQIVQRGIKDSRVIEAVRRVPRHRFVPEDLREQSYGDHPLPIGEGQTISQPFIVAYMSEIAEIGPDAKVLEIGTGSGYQAAVLAELAREVYTIEIISSLGEKAARILEDLNYDNIQVRIGDGYQGWPEQAPFDVILVTAAPETIPEELIQQLADGGTLVIPAGDLTQYIYRIRRNGSETSREKLLPVRFVPMVPGPSRGFSE